MSKLSLALTVRFNEPIRGEDLAHAVHAAVTEQDLHSRNWPGQLHFMKLPMGGEVLHVGQSSDWAWEHLALKAHHLEHGIRQDIDYDEVTIRSFSWGGVVRLPNQHVDTHQAALDSIRLFELAFLRKLHAMHPASV